MLQLKGNDFPIPELVYSDQNPYGDTFCPSSARGVLILVVVVVLHGFDRTVL